MDVNNYYHNVHQQHPHHYQLNPGISTPNNNRYNYYLNNTQPQQFTYYPPNNDNYSNRTNNYVNYYNSVNPENSYAMLSPGYGSYGNSMIELSQTYYTQPSLSGNYSSVANLAGSYTHDLRRERSYHNLLNNTDNNNDKYGTLKTDNQINKYYERVLSTDTNVNNNNPILPDMLSPVDSKKGNKFKFGLNEKLAPLNLEAKLKPVSSFRQIADKMTNHAELWKSKLNKISKPLENEVNKSNEKLVVSDVANANNEANNQTSHLLIENKMNDAKNNENKKLNEEGGGKVMVSSEEKSMPVVRLRKSLDKENDTGFDRLKRKGTEDNIDVFLPRNHVDKSYVKTNRHSLSSANIPANLSGEDGELFWHTVSMKAIEEGAKLKRHSYIGSSISVSIPTEESSEDSRQEKINKFKSYTNLAVKSYDEENPNNKRPEIGLSGVFSKNYTLWSELPKVIENGLIKQMSKREIEIQERWFEIITSEISYYKVLQILNEIIVSECKCILKGYDMNLIFTRHLDTILQLSKKFIILMQNRLKQDEKINNLFDIMGDIVYDKKFEVYMHYAGCQWSQKENFDRLMRENRRFYEVIQRLSNDTRLQGKDLSNYLIAPIQRLARYRLLIDAILKILPIESSEVIKQGMLLSKYFENLLFKANQKAKKYVTYAEAIKLQMLLKYRNKNMIVQDLVSSKRELLCHSDLISLAPFLFDKSVNEHSFTSRKKKFNTYQQEEIKTYHLILFTDLLLISLKEIQDDKHFYNVVEKYKKEQVVADLGEWKMPMQNDSRSPGDEATTSFNNNNETSCLLTLTIKSEKSTSLLFIKKNLDIKYCFICSKIDGENWLKYLSVNNDNKNLKSDEETNPEETHPAMVVDTYIAKNEKELDLLSGEFVWISNSDEEKEMFVGRRLKDSAEGWFPFSVVSILKEEPNENREKSPKMIKKLQSF